MDERSRGTLNRFKQNIAHGVVSIIDSEYTSHMCHYQKQNHYDSEHYDSLTLFSSEYLSYFSDHKSEFKQWQFQTTSKYCDYSITLNRCSLKIYLPDIF